MKKPSVTVILSAWGTGSTAVTGYLDHCGAYTCPPHVQTTDPRTPSCYEPAIYRHVLKRIIDEKTLSFIGDTDLFMKFLEVWLPEQQRLADAEGRSEIVLKHPLQTLLLPVLDAFADCRYVVVTRSLDKIEQTRQRRQWPATLGAAGAEVLYPIIAGYLAKHSKPHLTVAFEDFVRDETLRRRMVDHCRLSPTGDQLSAAEAFLH